MDRIPDLQLICHDRRRSILESADAVFTARGADAARKDVARHAKVGIGTLYRHFPTREALLAAACDDSLLALAEKSRAARAESPTASFAAFVEAFARSASLYRGLAASFGVVLQNHTAGCDATTAEGERLLREAQRAGKVRREVTLDDIVCVVVAVSLAATETPERVPRLVRMFLHGIETATKPR